MFSHLKYLAMTLVGPALFAAWINTGPILHHGFYNLFATYVVLCTMYCAGSGLMIWIREAQEKPWRFEKARELMRSKSYLLYFGFGLNLSMMLVLIWYGKFVIAIFLFAHMMLSVFIRYLYLTHPPHVPRPNRVDEDTEPMPL